MGSLPMIRLFGIATILAAAAIADPAAAQMPISPIYRTSPEQPQPTADKRAPAATDRAAATPAKRRGEKAAPSHPAPVEQEPVATAVIPPPPPPRGGKEGAADPTPSRATESAAQRNPAAAETPAASPPEARTEKAAAAPEDRPRKARTHAARRQARTRRQVRRGPAYYYRPPAYYARSPGYDDRTRGYGGGAYGPSPYSSEGP